MIYEKENNNQINRKDDFNLFEELDAAYRKDFLGEREYIGNTFTIKTTFEAVVVLLCLIVYLVLDLVIMIFIMQITGLNKIADFIGSTTTSVCTDIFHFIYYLLK